MYSFVNFLRSIVWTAVLAVLLTGAAIIAAISNTGLTLPLTLSTSAIAMAVLATKSQP